MPSKGADIYILVPVPYTEYEIAHLFTNAFMSVRGVGDGTAVADEVVEQRPDGRYSSRTYLLGNRIPSWISRVLPNLDTTLREESLSLYPNCFTNIKHATKDFSLSIATNHRPGVPGETLPESTQKRKVRVIDMREQSTGDYTVVEKKITVRCGIPIIAQAICAYTINEQRSLFKIFNARLLESRESWSGLSKTDMIDIERIISSLQNHGLVSRNIGAV